MLRKSLGVGNLYFVAEKNNIKLKKKDRKGNTGKTLLFPLELAGLCGQLPHLLWEIQFPHTGLESMLQTEARTPDSVIQEKE